MNIRFCHKLWLLFVTAAALSAPAQYTNRTGGLGPPARQVLVSPASFSVFPTTNSQGQALFDWMDDYWPRFTNGTYATLPTAVTNIQTLVNWLGTSLWYEASNPSNYVNGAQVISIGNTNWLSNTNVLLTIGDVTNQTAVGHRRFLGAKAGSYGFEVSITTGKVALSQSTLAAGTASFETTQGSGVYSNTPILDSTNYTASGRIHLGVPGWYQVSYRIGITASDAIADRAVGAAVVHNADTNNLILVSPWQNEVNAYLAASGLMHVTQPTNVYLLQLTSTYLSTSTVKVISTAFEAVYMGE